MKLIGAGLPRTGTLTQKVALEALGFGPCYHMVNVLANLELVGQWRAALDGNADWDQIFGGFQATVDWPGGFFYRELLERYPDAKVLLSVRDPGAWEHSMRQTVWAVYYGDQLMTHLSNAYAKLDQPWNDYLGLMTDMLWRGRGTLAQNHSERDGMIASMERHSEEVRRTVPAEQLLEWDVCEGWEPLCEFLKVDVPATPLPRLNDSQTFRDRVNEKAVQTINAWWATQQSNGAGPPAN